MFRRTHDIQLLSTSGEEIAVLRYSKKEYDELVQLALERLIHDALKLAIKQKQGEYR